MQNSSDTLDDFDTPSWLSQYPPLILPSTRAITAPTGYSLTRRYRWISPNTLLSVLQRHNRAYRIEDDAITVARMEVDTQQVKLLTGNTSATQHSNWLEFSPDGCWYLCISWAKYDFNTLLESGGRQRAHDDKRYYLCNSDDSEQHLVYSSHSGVTMSSPFAWFGDSRHWLLMDDNGEFELRSLAQPGVRLPVPIWVRHSDVSLVLSPGPVHTFLNSPDKYYSESASSVKAAIWDPNDPEKLDTFEIALPLESTVIEVVLSPAGDRIAWLLHVEHQLPEFSRLQKLMRVIHPLEKRRDSYQIWTTAIDGGSPVLVGVKEVKLTWPKIDRNSRHFPPPHWQHAGGVYGLAWNADGERLSFEYQESIWTIEVPAA